ncbi:MAG TPA: phosphoglycerate kinase [Caulobacteraceae bacterium]|nr:phosphoglycerate kinase [Caulobacteraceae bacterium]
MSFRSLDDAPPGHCRALVRVDFNVPMEAGGVADDSRILAAAPTIERLAAAGAKILLISHLGRPDGHRVASMSLEPVAAAARGALGRGVAFARDCVGAPAREAVDRLAPGSVLLLENLRFHPGEEANDPAFARELAANADFFVQDAFSVCHRAHASTVAITHVLPAFAGEAMRRELEALNRTLANAARPAMAIVGGSKVSTKLELLRHLIGRLDALAIGGGMANTFLYAQGRNVGDSYFEPELAEAARQVLAEAAEKRCEILLPTDVVVAERAAPGVTATTRPIGDVHPGERILDVGPETIDRLGEKIEQVRSLVWNGPLGVFEVPPFDAGTLAAAHRVARVCRAGKLVAVAGGGDTVAALNRAGVAGDFTFVSNAGGAFLEWMEGRRLPGVEALQNRRD